MGAAIAVNIELTKENAIGFRSSMGIDPKDRDRVNVKIDKALLEVFSERHHYSGRGARGELSNDICQGLTILYASRGWL